MLCDGFIYKHQSRTEAEESWCEVDDKTHPMDRQRDGERARSKKPSINSSVGREGGRRGGERHIERRGERERQMEDREQTTQRRTTDRKQKSIASLPFVLEFFAWPGKGPSHLYLQRNKERNNKWRAERKR